MARPADVPVDDRLWSPQVGPLPDGQIGLRHLLAASVGGHGADRDTQIAGDVCGRPPLGF